MCLDLHCRAKHRKGLTLVEVCVLVIVGFILIAVFLTPICETRAIDMAKFTSMRSKGRGIWEAIISANAEREPLGTTSVWPKALGFDKSRTSTEYFRVLMSDTDGCLTADTNRQIVADLHPNLLGGAGVLAISATAQFSKANNAWSVVCIGNDSPGEAPFLITRNVDVGSKISAATSPKLTKIYPFKQEHAVWVTRGGATFDARPKWLTADRLFPVTNETYDVMYP